MLAAPHHRRGDLGSGGQPRPAVDALQLQPAVEVGQQLGPGGRVAAVVVVGPLLMVVVVVHEEQHHARASRGGARNEGPGQHTTTTTTQLLMLVFMDVVFAMLFKDQVN